MRRQYFLIFNFVLGLALLSSWSSVAQPTVSIQNVKNACDGLPNGSFEILVTAANNPPLDANVFGPPNQGPFALTVGVPFTVSNLPGAVGGRSYVVIVQDADGSTVLNVAIFTTPVNLAASVGSSASNTSCVTPDGFIDVNVSGGSGAYSFQWSGPTGFVDPGTEDLTGLSAGSYSLTVFDANTNCTRLVGPINITDPSPTPFNVSTVTPSVCLGAGGTVNLDGSEGAAVMYQVYKDGIATGITQAGINGPLSFAIPAGLLSPINSYTFTVEAVNGFCAPLFMNGSGTIVVNPLPTITPVAIPNVCVGTTSSTLTYSATTGVPDQYRIDWDAAAETAGMVDVALTALPSSPIPITGIPVVGGTYNGILYVTTSGTTCESTGDAISVTVIDLPTITLGANPGVCTGITSSSLTYSATTGAPDQYRIDWNAAAEAAGMVDVVLTALPISPIPIMGIPVAAGTYNGTLYVRTSGTTCESIGDAISVTVDDLPTITLGANPDVCSGVTNSSLTYSATTGAPDQYRIDWNAAAETAGMVDVALSVLPVSPISIMGIPVAAGTYNGILYVRTSGTTCESVGDAISVTVNDLPTITLGANPEVCTGITSSNLTYSAITGAPDQYRIDWDPTAETAGMVDVALTALPSSPIPITGIPVAVGTYNGMLYVTTSGTTCESVGNAISVTVTGLPTITLGANPTVCLGISTANLTYSSTTNSPDQYRIDWDVVAEAAGLADVAATALPATPIAINNVPNTVGTYNGTLYVINNGLTCESTGDPISVNVIALPTITLGANPVVCAGITSDGISYSATTGTPDQFRIDWDGAAEGAGLSDVPATLLPGSPIPINNIPLLGGTYFGDLYVIDSGNGCESLANPISVTVQEVTATLSGNATTCGGSSTTLTVNFTGPGPTWNFTYSDGFSNTNLLANANPFTFSVSPIISTTYSLVNVTGATCGAGTVSGSATITVSPIAGNPSTFGSETWLAYVYDDSGSPAPPATNIDFNNTKYRGFLNETEIASISGFSSYDVTTDAFNLNLSNTIPVAGPNICGSYLNDYSIRFRMTKTFAAGIYTFTLGADDGVRLLVDGVSVLPAGAFNTHAFTTYNSAPVCLTAGTHNLVIEYFDRGGFSKITFDYSASLAPTVSSPVSLCVNSPAPILNASSVGAIDYNWYTDAALTNPPIFTGANYTPAPAQLEMTTVGTTNFFVTAVYACGETPAAQVTVDVTSGANIVLPPAPVQVCDVGGIIDLNTLVSATPAGGAFVFSGPSVTDPNFDPSGLGNTTVTINVDYSSGTCMASTSFDIDVVTNATITVPAAVTACESGGIVDLTALVSGNPSGGSLTFAGTGVVGTGPDFDPSGLSGLTTITVDYTVGGCNAPTQMFDINVVPNVSLVIDNSTTVCPSTGAVDLTALVTPTPGGGVFTFVGTGVTGTQFDPSGSAGSTVLINVSYDIGGCTAASTVKVVVRSATDPLCGGPTGNCATVTITPVPSAAICSPTDGSILFNINPAVPTVNNTGVRIDIVGTSATNLGISQTNFNDPLFTGLPVGTYDYTIEYGDPACIKTGQVTVLLGPDVVDFTAAPNSVNCFGSSGGVVLSGINGSDLADYTYEITQLGSVVTTGSITQLQSLGDVTLTGFGSGNFEIKLSQDQSATTSCPSPVQSARKPFTVTSPAANLDTLYVNKKISVPDLPTGSMVVGINESLQEPYEVRLELTQPLFPGQVYAQDFTKATRNALNLKVEFKASNLFAGGYLLSLRDSLGCRKDYAITIGVDNNLMVPNIFTPNGDGVNEVFFIRNMPDATEVTITNRWGKQVYSSKNYKNDWDGGDVADGVYYYRISAAGQSYSGWVEVLRGK